MRLGPKGSGVGLSGIEVSRTNSPFELFVFDNYFLSFSINSKALGDDLVGSADLCHHKKERAMWTPPPCSDSFFSFDQAETVWNSSA
jgi:hypothetical protein